MIEFDFWLRTFLNWSIYNDVQDVARMDNRVLIWYRMEGYDTEVEISPYDTVEIERMLNLFD